jgi:hypothetical protein
MSGLAQTADMSGAGRHFVFYQKQTYTRQATFILNAWTNDPALFVVVA